MKRLEALALHKISVFFSPSTRSWELLFYAGLPGGRKKAWGLCMKKKNIHPLIRGTEHAHHITPPKAKGQDKIGK